jgi:hypothetical protein
VADLHRDDLHALVDALQGRLIELHAQIATTFFLPPPAPTERA